MKKSLSIVTLVFCAFLAIGQNAPQMFNYQGVARDNGGNVLANQTVGLQISVLSGSNLGPAVFEETHSVTTNNFGLFNILIGSGTAVTGAMTDIDWGADAHWVNVALDASGGTSYTEMGTSQLLSVPYALYANSSSGSLDDAYGNGRTIDATNGALKVEGEDGLLVTGTHGSGANIEISGAGTRMFFNPKKAAFRAGNVTGSNWNNANVGDYSVSMGINSLASGEKSIALGDFAIASGNKSIALGDLAQATASNAIALGDSSKATGNRSGAFGYQVTASGTRSMAFGELTNATGENATAFGYKTMAIGAYSTAMGLETRAYSASETVLGMFSETYSASAITGWNASDRLLVVGNGSDFANRSNALTILKNGNTGIGESNPTQLLHLSGESGVDGIKFPDGTEQTTAYTGAGGVTLDAAYDEGGAGAGREIVATDGALKVSGADGFLVTGTHGSGAGIEVPGSESRMFFNPKKSAFRAGRATVSEWDESNVGEYSVGLGRSTVASGDYSVALGRFNWAIGKSSFSAGDATFAAGDYSVALGNQAQATGASSVAIGSNIASGDNSVAMGYANFSVGKYSVAMGEWNTAYSKNEIVFGAFTEEYVPINAGGWDTADRLFVVGNGNNESNRSNALTILKNGNTGIGTSTPTAKLHVANGNVVFDRNTDGTAGFRSLTLSGKRSGNANYFAALEFRNQDDLTEYLGSAIRSFNGAGFDNGDLRFYVRDGFLTEGLRITHEAEVYVPKADAGIIMKSPDGNCWKMTVSNAGAPVFTSVVCP
ncbi:MAG: hypothetical protein ACPGD8_04840 [Flavobacteriales bacterium]